MANKTKSRTSKSTLNKNHQLKFRWWMAVLLIIVVAITGVAILRLSRAATPATSETSGGSTSGTTEGDGQGFTSSGNYTCWNAGNPIYNVSAGFQLNYYTSRGYTCNQVFK